MPRKHGHYLLAPLSLMSTRLARLGARVVISLSIPAQTLRGHRFSPLHPLKIIKSGVSADISSIEDDNNKDKGEEEMDRLHWFEQNYEKYLTVDPPTEANIYIHQIDEIVNGIIKLDANQRPYQNRCKCFNHVGCTCLG